MANIQKLKITDKKYPDVLREISDPPKEIYAQGNLNLLGEKTLVAIVGSRKATSYGIDQTKKIAFELSKRGVVIVSGMALGIDAAAHQGALNALGKTIAVLGSAIDNFYPVQNENLGKKILEQGNLIISEYSAGSPTFKSNFPMRNRIIAGLSTATIITEAAERSGALITAYLALDYNRDVLALPGNIDRINSKGTNRLIRCGAFCVNSMDALLEFFDLNSSQSRQINLTNDEKKIIETLGHAPTNFDDILKEVKLTAGELNILIATLELKGAIRRNLNGEYGIY